MATTLSPDQLLVIDRFAQPLLPADRATFRRQVLEQLAVMSELGDGVIHRTCAEVQRSLFHPPDTSTQNSPRHLRKHGDGRALL